MAIRKEKKVSVDEYEKHYSEQIEQADKKYISSLKRLKNIRAKRLVHQTRELNRLSEKFGTSSPKVTKQLERIVKEQEMKNYINVAIDKSKINTTPIKGSYVLRGVVRSDNIKVLAGYKVQLQDNKNNVVGKTVRTDASGNYSIVLDVKDQERSKNLKLVVLDKSGVEIQTDSLPVQAKNDVVDMRDMVIAKMGSVDRGNKKISNDLLILKKKLQPKPKRKKATKLTRKKPTKKKIIKKPKK